MTTFSLTSGRPMEGLFTSEAVSDGHPDKICDQISDAILDGALTVDRHARVAIETAIKAQNVFLLGEINCAKQFDIPGIVKDVLLRVGHDADGKWGLKLKNLNLWTALTQQSREINRGVGYQRDLGAGDQGIMFGYATQETPERLALPHALARRLMLHHKALRTAEYSETLGPDAKAQVTVAYRKGKPAEVTHVVLSTQHAHDCPLDILRDMVRAVLIEPVLGPWLTPRTVIHINPAGTFHVGGPIADAGLTGRKIIADTYGGMGRHGGGAFSGKDPTKVDRSAAYMARHVAKSIVQENFAGACEVRVAYAIGQSHPVAIAIDADGHPDNDMLKRFERRFKTKLIDMFRPAIISSHLGLWRPLYQRSAAFGHFGDPTLPWEQGYEHVNHAAPMPLARANSRASQAIPIHIGKLFCDGPEEGAANAE